MSDWQELIRAIPDFPSPGIVFRDITPLLRDAAAFDAVVTELAAPYEHVEVHAVAAIESRGFMFGAPLALRLGAGFIPIRKLGKLPAPTLARQYSLEYGEGHLEIHRDAVARGDRILIVDDVLATGGTAAAAAGMVEELGGQILEIAFVLELLALGGRSRLPPHQRIRSLASF